MDPADEALALINAIYACASEPEGWSEALASASRFVGGLCGHFLVFDDAQVPRISIVGGVDPASGQEYDAHYARQDPRMAKFFAAEGQVMTCEDVVDAETFARSEFVNDFLIPWEARWCMVATFGVNEGLHGIWAAMRGMKQGAYNDAERQRLGILQPHIHRAVNLQFRLGVMEG